MASVSQILAIAAAEIGTSEAPADSNRTKYGAWYGMDGQPWCAQYLSWVFANAGMPIPATTSKGFAYVPSGLAYAERMGWFHAANPQPGDVVFFRFPGEAAGRANHIGIVEKVTGSNTIQTIEGNTQERVMRRARNTALVVGYATPPYVEPVAVSAADAAPGAQLPTGVALLPTKTGDGYSHIASDGGVFSYGRASFYGSMGGKPLNAPITGAARTPSGEGYVLVAADGGVFNFGDSMFHGSMSGKALNATIVDIAYAPDGNGYWLYGSDRGVFAFGSAQFHGSGVN